jgi:hypothetical protein
MPLVTAILWFYRFEVFPLGDDEYLSAKRRVRRTLTLWLAIASAQSSRSEFGGSKSTMR